MKFQSAFVAFFVLASISLPAAWAYDCQYGNSDYEATDWSAVDPDQLETYAFLIRPGDEDCGNGIGFNISNIRIWLAVQSGGSFDFQASVLEAVDNGGGCYTPGVTIETSEPSHITGWPEVGGIDVGADCVFDCLQTDRAYFLSIEFLAVNAEVLFPRSPDDAVCTSYIDRGEGFLDLQNIDGGGGLVIYCHSTNCDNPTPIKQSAWGNVKAQYR